MADLVNEEKTRAHLDNALASVVKFAREATKYYGRNCLSRLPPVRKMLWLINPRATRIRCFPPTCTPR